MKDLLLGPVSLKIHRIPMGMSQSYLIENSAGLVLVDAGLPHQEKRILRLMRSVGRDDLKLIFITHAHIDHYGSACALRRLTGAPIAIHLADGDSMARGETELGVVRGRGKLGQTLLPLLGTVMRPQPANANLLLQDGDDLTDFGLDAVVLHTPGHTAGSSSLIVESRFAFVGDLLSNTGRPRVQRFYAVDWTEIPKSVSRLQDLRPAWVYAGRGSRPINGKDLQNLTD